jgi:hypothetical protein
MVAGIERQPVRIAAADHNALLALGGGIAAPFFPVPWLSWVTQRERRLARERARSGWVLRGLMWSTRVLPRPEISTLEILQR